ncbi:MAG: molybdenum cofactor biosynthesis protein MoaE [Phycisphaerales bacterium JB038]
MNIVVQLIEGPLPASPAVAADARAGAVVCFEGIVRPYEGGRPLAGLEYEAYQPMAAKELEKLAARATRHFGLLAAHVEHSVGCVPIGDCSFRLRIESMHRREALEAMAWFIDSMKKDAPIWKKPIFLDENTAVGEDG